MEQDGTPSRSSGAPVLALLVAVVVVTLGTALVDPTRLPLLVVSGAFLILAFGAGALLDHLVGGLLPELSEWPEHPPILVLAVHLGVGLASLSLLAVSTALCGIFWVAGVVALPLLGYGLLKIIKSDFWHGGLPFRFTPKVLPLVAGGVVVGSAWLTAWLWATIPPIFYDELAYHLIPPQQAILTGGLVATPWVFFNMMPHASDVLLAWGMFFSDDLGARATHFALWVSCSLVAWGLAEAIAWPRSSPLTGPMAAGALAASPTLWFMATLPFAGVCLSVAIGTAIAVLAAPHLERRPWLAFGLVLGLALTVKLTGVYWVAAGLAAALVAGWSRRDLGRAALIALASVVPWWGRALVHTGNPIYPMGYGLLGGKPWSEASDALLRGDSPLSLADLGLKGLLRLPLDLVQHPERFGSAGDAGIMVLAATGAILVWPVISRLAGMGVHQRRLSDMAAVFLLVAGSGWVLTATTTRFLAPAMVIGVAALVGSALYLGRRGQMLAVSVLLVAGAWGTWRFIDQHSAAFSSSQVALGRENSEDYLMRQLDHYPAARFVRKELPIDAKLLFIGETRPYYFSRNAVAPSAYDRHPLKQWVEESSTPAVLSARLADEGFTHVVLNVREFRRHHDTRDLLAFSGVDAEANDRRLKELPGTLQTLFSENGVYVFEVPARSAATRTADGSGPRASLVDRPKH